MQPLRRNDEDEHDDLDIRDIIENKRLVAYFQPVVSVSRKMISGVEGLIRGRKTGSSELIPPNRIFEAAQREGLSLELDRACREKVLEAFSRIFEKNSDKLLFLNVDASVLERSPGSNYLVNQVKASHIEPSNIVIEINESKVLDNVPLKKFVEVYREAGFMIALDDVGTGFSNMDRILLVKPDIIKVDMSLIRNIDLDHYKQGIFRSLVNLSKKIGSLVVAEGVETREEATQILRLGGHMIQGFYFSKPQEVFDESDIVSYNKIETLSTSFNQYIHKKILDERLKNNRLNIVVNKWIKELMNVSCQAFDDRLKKIILENETIECAYILDEDGIQVSDTIRLTDRCGVTKSLIFYSAQKGTDLSMEKYYYPLISTRLKRYITEPYISLATGNLCVTYSKIFTNVDREKYILCIDFNANDKNFPIEFVDASANSDLFLNDTNNSIANIKMIINQMNEKIIHDSLTNIYNRRYIEEMLPVDVANAIKENQPISVILTDIDHFKKVNDTYGHLAGDSVLKEFTRIAKSVIRKNMDWIARYGGEEFLIVLRNADKEAAFKVSEKVRLAIQKAKIRYNEAEISITASLGTCTMHSARINCEQLIAQADRNLYKAKNTGRNKTIGTSLL